MKRKKLLLLLSPILILVVALLFILFFKQDSTLASEEEIVGIVQTHYTTSEIQSISQQNTEYTVVVQHNFGEYQLIIDGESREIISLKQISSNTEDGSTTGEPREEPEQESAPSMLTELQAIEIALQEVSGTLDDIELEEENGIKVYEVEINVDDETEALVIINAYTGKILSVTLD
ncbi:PepSY domain-containing protein [Sutcliffiella halmapala]|uniref:PepSY domain-containing protein n=1 Tax=Sutcliffiella halmapala TaxID=79882 RepID=UPI000994A2D2|nr:PepSY domain-containing protein [Sutcliffiella halmapala]